MTTVAEMQTQLDALRKARASGIRRVEHDNRAIDYKTDAEMAAAIADLERRISASSRTPVRHVFFTNSKGL